MNTQSNSEGCRCQQCGHLYRLDIMVDNEIWERIKPHDKPPGSGLLCGSCIVRKAEELTGFGVMRLVRHSNT